MSLVGSSHKPSVEVVRDMSDRRRCSGKGSEVQKVVHPGDIFSLVSFGPHSAGLL